VIIHSTALSSTPLTQVEAIKPVIPDNRSRAQEFMIGQTVGVAASIGAVWAGRTLFPAQIQAISETIAKQLYPKAASLTPDMLDAARQRVNIGLMFSGGLLSSITTQTILSRQRRAQDVNTPDMTPVQTDIGRLTAGWGAGLVGASTAWWLAQHYAKAGNPYAVSDLVGSAERFLDKALFSGAELTAGNRLSEAVIANLVMIPGALPFSLAAQKLYDQLIEPETITQKR
jgi:hypothetical protein